MTDAIETIVELIEFSEDREKISAKLAKVAWDFDGKPVVLTKSNIESVLNRYADGELTREDLEWWANAIEGREHIEYEEDYMDKIETAIFALANPILEGFAKYEDLIQNVKNDFDN